MKDYRAVATEGALKVVESMGMADMVDNPDVFTTLEKSTVGMVERVSLFPSQNMTAVYTDDSRSILRPKRRRLASSWPSTARFCHGRFDWLWSWLAMGPSNTLRSVFDFSACIVL
jgi:hypothetical protein